MANIERVTVDELDVADATQDGDKLIIETADGKVKSVTKKNLINNETQARITEDAALQLQINTMAGVSAGSSESAPAYRIVEKLDAALKGANNGVAELDENGKIPRSQIYGDFDDMVPCYGVVQKDETGNVTDIQVYEDEAHTIPVSEPVKNRIYLDVGEGGSYHYQYMWAKVAWGMANETIVIGESASNAYRGDRGKVAYEHSQVRGTGTVTADNPHGLSKADIGLGNVPDVTTNNQTPTYEVASDNAELTSGETLSTAFGKIAKIVRSFISHITNTSNPHSVTKAQVGLGDVTNVATTSTIMSGDTKNITSGAVYTALSALDSAKQNRTLDTPLMIDGTSRTTVESALGSLNTSKLRQVTTMPASPSSWDTVLYLGSETGYLKGTIYQYDGTDWKIISGAGGGGTVAHFAAMSDWETARLITEGNEGFLADDSLVVIDATGLIYIQNGTGSTATLTAIDKSLFYVSALPTGSAIDDVIYYNTTDSKYYVGNKTAQTTRELDVESIKYVSTLPVTPNVDNKFYVPSSDSIIYVPVSVNLKDFIDSYCNWSGYKSTYAVADGSSHSGYGSNELRYYAIASGIEYYIKGSSQASLNTFYKVNGVVAGKTNYDDYHQDNLPYAYGQFCEKAFSGSSDSDLETYCKREDQHGVFKNTQRLRCSNSFEAAYEKFSEINITLYLKTTAVKGKLYYGDKKNQTLTKVGGNNAVDAVDTVENGNMSPVTSNAVYDGLAQEVSNRNTAISNDRTSHFGCNPSGAVSVIGEQIVTSSVSWTATSNGYMYFMVRLTEGTQVSARINGTDVWNHFSGSNGTGASEWTGIIVSGFVPIKSGQVFSIAKGYGPTESNICKIEAANFIPAN